MKRNIEILFLTFLPIGISMTCGILNEWDETKIMINMILTYEFLIYWRKVDEAL